MKARTNEREVQKEQESPLKTRQISWNQGRMGSVRICAVLLLLALVTFTPSFASARRTFSSGTINHDGTTHRRLLTLEDYNIFSPGSKGKGKGSSSKTKAPTSKGEKSSKTKSKATLPPKSKSKSTSKSKKLPSKKTKIPTAHVPMKYSKKSAKVSKAMGKITRAPHPSAQPSPSVPTIKGQPSPAPEPSLAPNTQDITIELAEYTIGYEIAPAIPRIPEVEAAATVTQIYLDAIFAERFPTMTNFENVATDDRLILGRPFEIDYRSAVTFPADIETIPTTMQMEMTLAAAFTGDTNQGRYIALLKTLGEDNIFSTATSITFGFRRDPSTTFSYNDPGSNTLVIEHSTEKGGSSEQQQDGDLTAKRAGIIAGSLGGALIIAALAGAVFLGKPKIVNEVFFYRDERDPRKKNKKKKNQSSPGTVAGETEVASTQFSGDDSVTLGVAMTREAEDEDGEEEVIFVCNDARVRWATSPILEVENGVGQDYSVSSRESSYTEEEVVEQEEYSLGPSPAFYASNDMAYETEDEEVPMRVIDLIQKFSQRR